MGEGALRSLALVVGFDGDRAMYNRRRGVAEDALFSGLCVAELPATKGTVITTMQWYENQVSDLKRVTR
jgi:hypothetical protein